jgi:hypothetical protein
MPFHVEQRDSDSSISNSSEPDLKTLSISLHRFYTLYLLVLLSAAWSKIAVHVNLTSPHPGAEVSTEYLLKGSTFLWRYRGVVSKQAGPWLCPTLSNGSVMID